MTEGIISHDQARRLLDARDAEHAREAESPSHDEARARAAFREAMIKVRARLESLRLSLVELDDATQGATIACLVFSAASRLVAVSNALGTALEHAGGADAAGRL